MGEDERTYNNLPLIKGNGMGPCYYDDNLGEIVMENKGVASYYRATLFNNIQLSKKDE